MQLKNLVYVFPTEFYPEDYYLLRMGKFIILFNVIERGCNQIIASFRGLEIQEPTSCHNIEANSIDDIVKSVTDKNGFLYKGSFTIM